MAIRCWVIAICVCAALSFAQTARDSNSRLGANTSESLLTPSRITANQLTHLADYTINGNTYSQPLIVPGITISSRKYDLLITITLNEDVYAFDANQPGSTALWHVTLGTPRPSSDYPNNGGEQLFYSAAVGCLGTPAIDPTGGYIYLECTNSSRTHIFYKLSLVDGSTLGQVTITGSVSGTGDPTGGDTASGGTLTFYPAFELSRPGITLANGNAYIAFGSWDDVHPWHGWIFSVDTATMTINHIWCATPNGYGGAIWPAGGPTVDASGNLYVITGNGDCTGTNNYSESIVKLSSTLTVLDYFTPSDCATMASADKDMSAGPMLIPNTTQVVAAAKDGRIFSIDTTCMGQVSGTVGGCSPQIWGSGTNGIMNMFYMNNTGYFSRRSFAGADSIYAYPISGSTWTTTASATSAITSYFPGASIEGSSNSSANGIVWALTVAANASTSAQAATFRALNASTLVELWNDGGTIGNLSKYTSPTIHDGKIYVATQSNKIAVYGVPLGGRITGNASITGNATIQ